MSKAILEFNLPEDRSEYYMASQGSALYSALWDLDQWLRAEIKYKEVDESYQKIRDKLYQIMDEHHINLDEVE
jgi:hypothetical protein